MQKFVVPQFIDVENKILGPITVRQFVTVAVGGVFVFIAYKLADFSLFLVWTAFFLLVTILVGFVRFNGLPFHIFLLNVIGTYRKPMLRVWLKESAAPKRSSIKEDQKKKGDTDKTFVPKKVVGTEKLSELALIIDTGGIYKGEDEANRVNRAYYAK